MCRRRFFKSYLYIEYGGIKYKNGETVSVSPFLAEGNSTTIVLDSARPWNVTNNISWLTVSSSSNKSGTYTITLIAAANQSYDGRSGSFTAKTLDDRYSIVVSVSQQAQAVEYRNLTVSPVSMTLGNDDKFNGKPIQAFVDEYINGSYAQTKEITTEATWTSQNNSVAVCAAVSNGEVVKPVYGSGYYPEERGTTVTASYLGSAATCNVEVEPQGLDEYRLDVLPASVVINSDGTQALTVWARYYVDGVYTPSGDELITDSSEYEIIETSVPDLISVDNNGVIHGNGVAAGGTATIRVSNYPTTGSKYADVEVTVNPTSITYRNLVVNPTSMELDTSDLTNGKTIQAYADEYINGTFNRTIEVTSAASWSSQDTSVAACESVSNNEVVKPVYGSGDYPTTRTTTVTTNYMGSAATCTVSVAPEGRVTYLLVVSPTEARIGSNGSTSLTATLQAYVDGVRDSSQDRTVTTSANYNESSNLIEVDSAGHVTGTGQLTGGDAIITVSHQDAPNSVSVTIHVNDAAVDEYLEITPASTSTTWNGQVTYEVFYVKEVNGQKTSTKITDASVLRFGLDDGTVGEMNGFVFEAENISTAYTDEEISVTCTAGTYNGLSTRTPAELRVNGASSVVYRLDVEAVPSTIAYSGSSQLRASAVTVVNGNVYDWYVPSDVVWSENSTALTINGSTATGTHTGTSATDVTVTGTSQSFGQSGTAAIRISGRPEGKLTIKTDTEYVVDSGAGTCNYYISWAYLKPGTTINLSDSNLESFSPTSIAITDSNYTGGNVTVSADYEENPSQSQRDLYLYGTATTYYNQTKTDSDYYRQNGQHVPTVTYELEVDPTSVILNYDEETNLTVTYYVVTDGQRDGGTDVSTTATFTNTGSNSTAITIDSDNTITGANTGNTDEDVTVVISYGLATPVNAVITSNKKKEVLLDVTTDSEWKVSSGAGTCLYYIEWKNLKAGTRITLDDDNLTSYSPTYVSITSSNYTGGTATITANYGANPDTSSRRLYLYASATSMYAGDSLLADNDYYEQNEKYVPATAATINFGDLILNECSNSSVYDLTNMKLSAFTIFDENGNSISSNSLTIGTLPAHEEYEVTNVGWRSSSLSTSIGQTLTARLYFYFNFDGEEGDIDPTAAIWVGDNQIYGTYDPDLSVNGYQVFDFDLGTVPSAGILNYGDVEIIFGIEGGEGGIRVTCLDKLIDNTGGTSEFTVSWHDMAENGTITIQCSGDSGVVVLRHTMSPNTFTGKEGNGRVYVELGQNPLGGGRFAVYASGYDFNNQLKIAQDYGEQNGGYVPPVHDCNFSLSYEGQTPVPYDGTATFKLYYGDDVDTSTIGVIQQNPVIDEISLVDVTAGEMNVIVDLLPNCSSTNRTFPFALSALCGSETVTASNDTVEQAHQIGYPITVSNNVYALVINNTSQDIYLNGLQVYSKNDCSSANLYQFPFGNAEMIPASGQKQIMTVLGGFTRDNDTQIWGEWSFSNLPQNSYTELRAGGFQIAEPGMPGAADITHTVTISPGNIILQVRML